VSLPLGTDTAFWSFVIVTFNPLSHSVFPTSRKNLNMAVFIWLFDINAESRWWMRTLSSLVLLFWHFHPHWFCYHYSEIHLFYTLKRSRFTSSWWTGKHRPRVTEISEQNLSQCHLSTTNPTWITTILNSNLQGEQTVTHLFRYNKPQVMILKRSNQTLWWRALLKRQIMKPIAKKFPAFYETIRSVTLFTKFRLDPYHRLDESRTKCMYRFINLRVSVMFKPRLLV
jgi:hypothetical protein